MLLGQDPKKEKEHMEFESMITVLFVLPCFLYLSDGICIEKKFFGI